jgi:hypothetical protein
VFSDFIPNYEIRFKLGWYFIGIYMFTIVVNLLGAFSMIIVKLKNNCIDRYRKKKVKDVLKKALKKAFVTKKPQTKAKAINRYKEFEPKDEAKAVIEI